MQLNQELVPSALLAGVLLQADERIRSRHI